MKILFIHQNFPAQFKHLAPALVRQGHDVVALVLQKNEPLAEKWEGVRLIPYSVARESSATIHPWVADLETQTIRAEGVFRKALELQAAGFQPDCVIAHPGWGETLFIKQVWPHTKLGIYCEFFYHAHGMDGDFDPEFGESSVVDACYVQMKNINNMLHLGFADAGLSPTHWQADTFPQPFRSRISVIHDGIDTEILHPDPDAGLTLNNQIVLNRQEEIITFVARALEPYRGFHIFMRMLPELLAQRPRAKVVIVGGDDGGYGVSPTEGGTWKNVLFNEIKDRMPASAWSRVLFLGRIPYPHLVTLLRLSSVHVYLTYPFVLSWSLLEAMSLGCTIVASDTPPLREAIQAGETGLLVDFFAVSDWVQTITALLENPAERERLGRNARAFAQSRYDLKTVCLPQQLAWIERLMET